MLRREDIGLSSEGPAIMDVFQDFEHYSTGGLMFVNQEKMKRQRAIIWEFLKTVGKKLFTGAIFRISMPVKLCEPRSFLERMSDQWAYLPVFLNKAAETPDAVERLKFVMAFAISGLHLTVGMEKPFNPILGETFQSEFSDGSQAFVEQVSHHPPICSWLISGPEGKFTYYGSGESVAKFRTNAMTVGMKGTHQVSFPDGTVIKFQTPLFNISGVVMGNRVVEYFGDIVFIDEKNSLIGHVKFADPSSKGYFSWGSSSDEKSDSFSGFIRRFEGEAPTFECADFKDSRAPLSKASGSWIDDLCFDGIKYWARDVTVAEAARPPALLLPSDSRLRTDVVAVSKGDWELADKEKLKLEQIQRTDRKLRERFCNESSEPMSP